MNMNFISRRNCFLVLTAFGALTLALVGHAAPPVDDESDLPETLRSGYVFPIDGPADNQSYARGNLSLVRTNFGRASLFVAWRVMNLPVGSLASESHDRKSSWLHPEGQPSSGEDEIQVWLKVRGTLLPQAPAVAPDYYRRSTVKLPEGFEFEAVGGQCGTDAYAFATRTLRELTSDTSLTDAQRKTWIAGQDAVFARCAWTPGTTPAPALPSQLPPKAPAKLKSLNAYQRAAALFYGDDYVAARKEFDAIAATPANPMRAWAVLGGLRSILREAVQDKEWEAVVQDAWTKRQLRGDAFNAAVAEPAARRRARVNAALTEFNSRAKAALDDPALAPAHKAIRYTARRAYLQLSPAYPFSQAMTALDRPEFNPYTMGTLDLFQQLYPSVAPDRPQGSIATALRQHEWFDFTLAVQACSSTMIAANPTVCDSEHGHALARWQETKSNAWLLAALMTARVPSAADLPAAIAARAVARDRPEWASLQFYAARVLRSQGRTTDARAALDALTISTFVHKRDRELVETERRAL